MLQIMKSGKKWIPKSATKELREFGNIFYKINILYKIAIMWNNILLKSNKIILSETLQKKPLESAHKDYSPGNCSMERRLWSYFFLQHAI